MGQAALQPGCRTLGNGGRSTAPSRNAPSPSMSSRSRST